MQAILSKSQQILNNYSTGCSIRLMTALLEYFDLDANFKSISHHFIYNMHINIVLCSFSD